MRTKKESTVAVATDEKLIWIDTSKVPITIGFSQEQSIPVVDVSWANWVKLSVPFSISPGLDEETAYRLLIEQGRRLAEVMKEMVEGYRELLGEPIEVIEEEEDGF